jgi:hypothetical protein
MREFVEKQSFLGGDGFVSACVERGKIFSEFVIFTSSYMRK